MARKKDPGKKQNPYLYIALAFFVLGIVCMAYAVHIGEAEVGIFLIFPFVIGGGMFSGLGGLFIILGFLALFVNMFKSFTFMTMDDYEEEPPVRRAKGAVPVAEGRERARSPKGPSIFGGGKGGGVIFLGPIPITFGSDAKVTRYMLYLAIVAVVGLCLLFFYLSFKGA
jgi:uncharacterized protein (TIGR00304 family)